MTSSEANQLILKLMKDNGLTKSGLSEILGISLGVICNSLNHDDTRLDGVRLKILIHLSVKCEIRKEIVLIDADPVLEKYYG